MTIVRNMLLAAPVALVAYATPTLLGDDQAQACAFTWLCGVEGKKHAGPEDPVKKKKRKQKVAETGCVKYYVNKKVGSKIFAVSAPPGAVSKCAKENAQLGYVFTRCGDCQEFLVTQDTFSPGKVVQAAIKRYGNVEAKAISAPGYVEFIYLPAGLQEVAGHCIPNRTNLGFKSFSPGSGLHS